MRQFYFLVICIYSIPNISKNIFTVTFNFVKNFINGNLRLFTFFVAWMNQMGKLLQLLMFQLLDVHHVNQSPDILKLFLGFIELITESFQLLISEGLIYGTHQSFKTERETWHDFFKFNYVWLFCKLFLQQNGSERIKLSLTRYRLLCIIAYELFKFSFQFLNIVNGVLILLVDHFNLNYNQSSRKKVTYIVKPDSLS